MVILRGAPCPVCQLPLGLNKEDILPPRWARRLLTEFLRGWPTDPTMPPNETLRICTPCNSFLGKRFQDRASVLIKPIMRGQEVTLLPRDQVAIASWVVMTEMLLQIKHTPTERASSARRLLHELATIGVPPPGACVRIGFQTIVDMEEPPESVDHILPPEAWPPPEPGYRAISGMGQIIWEMVIPKRPGDLDAFISATRDLPGPLFQIWPVKFPSVRIFLSSEEVMGPPEFRAVNTMWEGIFGDAAVSHYWERAGTEPLSYPGGRSPHEGEPSPGHDDVL